MRTVTGEHRQVSGPPTAGPTRAGEELGVSVSGPFDLEAALRVARVLTDADDEAAVRIDLTRVSHFEDSAMAVLARALAVHRYARIHGLRQHQLRLLRYLGVEGVHDSAADSEPAWTS